jgi:hypothetical protein
MNTTGSWLATLLAGAACAAGSTVGTEALAAPAATDAADGAAVPIAITDFTIFLDPPTGFVFVKLPQGWQFVGRVQRTAQEGGLPAHVRTALLPGEAARQGRVADVSGEKPAANRK